MEEFKSQAKEKLEKEYTECKGKLTNIEKAMASAVYDTLRGFIEQDDEFAQSIVQNSQTFANCMSAVTKGVKSSISDLEAYKKAVQFYFPGASVEIGRLLCEAKKQSAVRRVDEVARNKRQLFAEHGKQPHAALRGIRRKRAARIF